MKVILAAFHYEANTFSPTVTSTKKVVRELGTRKTDPAPRHSTSPHSHSRSRIATSFQSPRNRVYPCRCGGRSFSHTRCPLVLSQFFFIDEPWEPGVSVYNVHKYSRRGCLAL